MQRAQVSLRLAVLQSGHLSTATYSPSASSTDSTITDPGEAAMAAGECLIGARAPDALPAVSLEPTARTSLSGGHAIIKRCLPVVFLLEYN